MVFSMFFRSVWVLDPVCACSSFSLRELFWVSVAFCECSSCSQGVSLFESPFHSAIVLHVLMEFLGSSQLFFFMLLQSFYFRDSAPLRCSSFSTVSSLQSWFLSLVVPHVLLEYLYLSLGSSQGFLIILLESFFFWVLVLFHGCSSCSGWISQF